MKAKTLALIGLIACALMLSLGCRAHDNRAKKGDSVKPIKLKVVIAAPKGVPGPGTIIPWIADRISVLTDGSVQMAVFEPGKLVKVSEILDAVADGNIDAGHGAAGFWQGKMPASPLFSAIPFGPEAGEYLAWIYYGNGAKLYQEMYDRSGFNVKAMPCGLLTPETSGWFREEIRGAEGLKGLKMRFFGLGGKVMSKLGVAVSQQSGAQLFPDLEKKVLDATEYSMPAADERLGLHKIAKFNYFPGWHQQATFLELLVNKDVWNEMSESQRQAVDMMCRAATLDSYAYTEAIEGPIVQKNEQERGVKNVYWSAEMLELFKTTWREVAKEQAEKDEFFKRVYEDLENFRAKYDSWRTLAFLPRTPRAE